MKNSLLFKTGVLTVVGIFCLTILSCKKKTASTPSPLITFKKINVKLGTKARYPQTATASTNKNSFEVETNTQQDERSSVFSDKNKDNYDIELATNLFTTATSSNSAMCNGVGDLLLLEFEVESGVTNVTVKKVETETSTVTSSCSSEGKKGERFSFALGKLTGTKVTDLPDNLTNKDNQNVTASGANVIVIKTNVSYKTIDSLLGGTQNKVVLSVTATKDGRTTTKTITIKGKSA